MPKSWRCLTLLLSLLTLGLEQAPTKAQMVSEPMVSVLPQIRSPHADQGDESPPPEFNPGTLGICGFYNLSGYLAVAADGELVTLKSYCQQQRNWIWYEEDRFWRRFREAANQETLTFAQTLDRHQIEAYAQSICAFLQDGGTPSDLRQIQTDNRLPAGFEQAVTVAAVRTYCRQQRRGI